MHSHTLLPFYRVLPYRCPLTVFYHTAARLPCAIVPLPCCRLLQYRYFFTACCTACALIYCFPFTDFLSYRCNFWPCAILPLPCLRFDSHLKLTNHPSDSWSQGNTNANPEMENLHILKYYLPIYIFTFGHFVWA